MSQEKQTAEQRSEEAIRKAARSEAQKNAPANRSGIRKWLSGLGRDLWIVLLDIFSVNAAYLLALLVRFYVNFQFRPTVKHYLTFFWQFAPYYTVICILVFILFRLYGGMWRYAGVNDMNRILLANLVTCAVQVAGTLLFFPRRMPVTYYIIGAVLQLVFMTLSRFAYRIIIVERRKIHRRKLPAARVMIVGAGEMGRRMMRHLEDDTGRSLRPVVVIDTKGNGGGQTLDGIPVAEGTERIPEIAAEYHAGTVLIADPLLTPQERVDIRTACQKANLELEDYTGYLSNMGGHVSLTGILETLKGPVILEIGDEKKSFADGEQALLSLSDPYTVAAVSAENGAVLIRLTDSREEAQVRNATWVRKHQEETGEEISFF